jgi:hypothetical protein
MGVSAMKWPAALASVSVMALARMAHASGPLGPNDSPIRTSEYAIDLSAGPVIAGPRALALGGAYVAIAEGVDGDSQNPASPAVRAAWSDSHVDFDAALTLLFPSALRNTDFFNTGRPRTDLGFSGQNDFSVLSPMGNLQVGPWGMGLGLELQRYGILRQSSRALGGQDTLVRAQISTAKTFLARAVDDGQLVGGLGFSVTALDVTTDNEIVTRHGNVFTTRGVNLEGGLLWRPDNERFRVGFALRAPVTTEVASSGAALGEDTVLPAQGTPEIWLPNRVKRPWSADFGVAVSLGPRPFNVPFLDPVELMQRVDRYLERRALARDRRRRAAEAQGQAIADSVEEELRAEADDDARYRARERERLGELLRQRYRGLPRRYLLISYGLHADGNVSNSVGIESFLERKVNRSGEHVTLGLRLGAETEAIENWLKLRAGSYLEPSRFSGVGTRVHGTGGFDVKLFRWNLFGLLDDDASLDVSAAGDYTKNYFGWALAFGVWR